MKKILVVQRGLTHYRKLLLQYVQECGEYEIDIANVGKQYEKKDNIYFFPARDLLRYKNYALQQSDELINFIKRNYQNYDYIILEGAPNLINNIPICKFLIKQKKPYIVWDAGRRKNSKMSLPRKLAQIPLEFVWKHASAIIAYSTLAKAYFTGIGIPQNKIFVCQNTLCVEAFDSEIQKVSDHELEELRRKYAPKGQKIILYVGAVEKRKRIIDLIDAFDKIRQQNNKTVLIIIGGGEQLAELEQCILGKEDIHLLGPIIDGVIPYFLLADVFALPSEGGLSLNQAMICSKPVIASSADGTELDLIEEGNNGYLFAETNTDELAEKILLILSDDDRKCRMGECSRKIIEENVNEKIFYANWKKCLESVAALEEERKW